MRPLIWVQPGLHQAELIEKLGPEQPVYCVARPYLDRTKTPLKFDKITSFHVETVHGLCPGGPYARRLVGLMLPSRLKWRPDCSGKESRLAL